MNVALPPEVRSRLEPEQQLAWFSWVFVAFSAVATLEGFPLPRLALVGLWFLGICMQGYAAWLRFIAPRPPSGGEPGGRVVERGAGEGGKERPRGEAGRRRLPAPPPDAKTKSSSARSRTSARLASQAAMAPLVELKLQQLDHYNGAEVGFNCPHCSTRLYSPVTREDWSKGLQVLCSKCCNITLVPASLLKV